MHKRGARGAAANRNAVIMDAVPATVVHRHEGTATVRSRGTGAEERERERKGWEQVASWHFKKRIDSFFFLHSFDEWRNFEW